MEIKWNEQQQNVIDFRQGNLLVSAAAGSGKTAVLTEHVVKRVLDEENGCDMNQLLIMTFTSAAAGEMRERIRKRLNEELKKTDQGPRRNRIRRQISLLSIANISTMHSFCFSLIKEYFYKAELAPGSKIGDDTELKLMLSDCVDEVLDEWYAKCLQTPDARSTAFAALSYSYGEKGRKDFAGELIRIYEHSRTHSDPQGWLQYLIDFYSDEKSYQKMTQIAAQTFTTVDAVLYRARELAIALYERIKELDAPKNKSIVQEHIAYIDTVLDLADAPLKLTYIKENNIAAGTFKKSEFEPMISTDEIKGQRDVYIKMVRDLKKTEYPTLEEFQFEQHLQLPLVSCLVDLLRQIGEKYTEQKRKKRLLDYNDLEHLALQLLSEEEVRRDYQQRFCEILVDEYQDSSEVQNTLLNYLNEPDKLFMVGDVKQSIYAFRQAKPKYFIEKYDRYREVEGYGTCICLNQNYRSRKEVLDAINGIFTQIMQKQRGGIEYDDDNALHIGKGEPVFAERSHKALTLHNVVRSAETQEKGFGEKQLSLIELEACVTAENIKRLVQEEIWDGEQKQRVRYRDIVILARSVKQINEGFLHILQDVYGIPCCTTIGSAYFNTLEINTLLSFLQIVDNPRQDIPLVSTLVSDMFGFRSSDLARIRISTEKQRCFYERLQDYAVEGELKEKIGRFLAFLEDVRNRASFLSLPELLEYMMKRTEYRSIAAAMPGGRGRIVNIDMLIQKAKDFEKTNYRGVYQFLRYINKIKEHEIDLESPSILSEAEDVVRIMTIHKSKGLEFPIVFLVSGNRKLVHTGNERIKIHPELGVAFDHPDIQERLKVASKIKPIFSRLDQTESLYEELRVLYVALTRAKAYLHVVSGVSEAFELPEELPMGRMDDVTYAASVSYYDWLREGILHQLQEEECRPGEQDLFGGSALYGIHQYFADPYCEFYHQWKSQNRSGAQTIDLFRELEQMLQDPARVHKYEEEIQRIAEDFSRQYRFGVLAKQKAIVSVSELKHAAMEEYYGGEDIFGLNQNKQSAEDFVSAEIAQNISGETLTDRKEAAESADKTEKTSHKNEPNKGALRGTAYHNALERFNFGEIVFAKPEERNQRLQCQIDELVEKGLLNEEERDFIRISDMLRFFESNLARRMAEAEKQGALWKEKRFLFALPADEYFLRYAQNMEVSTEISAELREDFVLLRGIIDAFFEENGEYVIMDYKTDRVSGEKAEEELQGRYGKQLEIYRNALEQMTGKKVQECILYSFALKKEIRV